MEMCLVNLRAIEIEKKNSINKNKRPIKREEKTKIGHLTYVVPIQVSR